MLSTDPKANHPTESGPSFRNLHGHILTAEEKLWLCKEVEGSNAQSEDSIHTKKGLIRRYNLSAYVFKNHFKNFKKYGYCLNHGGQPIVDIDGSETIKRKILEATYRNDEMTKSDLKNLLSEEAILKRRKHSLVVSPNFVSVCDKTVNRFISKNEILINNKNKHTTKAREESCSCPYVSYVWYLVCLCLSKDLPPSHKWNADATTFVFLSQQNSAGLRLSSEAELDYVDDLEVRLAELNPDVLVKKNNILDKDQASNYLIHQKFHLQLR